MQTCRLLYFCFGKIIFRINAIISPKCLEIQILCCKFAARNKNPPSLSMKLKSAGRFCYSYSAKFVVWWIWANELH